MASEPERLYTAEEAAQILRCSIRTIYRDIAAGRLAASRPRGRWLITATALHAFIDGMRPLSPVTP